MGRLAALTAHWPLGLVVVAGALLRWFSAGRIAVWRDEAQYLAVSRLPDFGAITSFLYQNESHPPLFYYLGHVAGRIFGSAEAPMSAFSFAASVAAIVVVYAIADAAFSRAAALIAATGTALSIPLTVYSVQLRPYALLSVLFLVSHAALWLFWSRRSRGWLGVWAAASLLALYTHYMTVLVLAGQAIIALWLLRPAPLRPGERRALFRSAAGAALLALPALWLLVHQAQTTSYPGLRPLELVGPPRLLLALALNFPFELALPLVLGLAIATGALSRASHARRLLSDPRSLLIAPVPVFLVLATLATYRSQFLTPHVVLAIVPLGALMLGCYVSFLLDSGFRLAAALWIEAGVALSALSGISSIGYSKTTIDLVAAGVAAEARTSDLLFVAPGVAGTSFNRYFEGSNSQVSYPYPGPLALYPFAHDFKRVSSNRALQMGVDSIERAYRNRRRVWFIADIRWIRPDLDAPAKLSRDSFGGIGQADRARVNRFDRHLRSLYGEPVMQLGAIYEGSGPEAFAAWLFARTDSPPVASGAPL